MRACVSGEQVDRRSVGGGCDANSSSEEPCSTPLADPGRTRSAASIRFGPSAHMRDRPSALKPSNSEPRRRRRLCRPAAGKSAGEQSGWRSIAGPGNCRQLHRQQRRCRFRLQLPRQRGGHRLIERRAPAGPAASDGKRSVVRADRFGVLQSWSRGAAVAIGNQVEYEILCVAHRVQIVRAWLSRLVPPSSRMPRIDTCTSVATAFGEHGLTPGPNLSSTLGRKESTTTSARAISWRTICWPSTDSSDQRKLSATRLSTRWPEPRLA